MHSADCQMSRRQVPSHLSASTQATVGAAVILVEAQRPCSQWGLAIVYCMGFCVLVAVYRLCKAKQVVIWLSRIKMKG